MDMTQIDEQWIELPRVLNRKNYIVAISNTGKYRRVDGSEGALDIRHHVRIEGKPEKCSHVIAEHFLITVKRPDQTWIDHITHYPAEYNVNDVRNLRWCTKAENQGFEEARVNVSKAMRGARVGSNHPMWKGDDASPRAHYYRAKKLYKAGQMTEEEFQTYRDALQEYRRDKKATYSPLA